MLNIIMNNMLFWWSYWATAIFVVIFVELADCRLTGKARFSRIGERLGLIEIRQNSESSFRQQGTDVLFEKLEKIERMLNDTVHLNNDNDGAGSFDDEKGDDKSLEDGRISMWRSGWDRKLENLFKAFKDEKHLNARIRRQTPDIENKLNECILGTAGLANNVMNMSTGIENANKLIIGISQLIDRNDASFNKIDNSINQLIDKVDKTATLLSAREKRANSCLDLYKNGHRENGIYNVYPNNRPSPIQVYCDQKTDGGGWTIFQRREDGSENFYRGWLDYKFGFGNPDGEFWLGNEYLSSMVTECCHELRIDLEDFEGNRRYAKYAAFKIDTKTEHYTLTVSGYSGDAKDSFSGQSGYKFSTKDKDNDVDETSCAQRFKGGWWYSSCHGSNLNGLYHIGKYSSYADGVNWRAWLGYQYSLKNVQMMFK